MTSERMRTAFLALISILVSYAVLDYLVIHRYLHWFPLKLHTELGRIQYLAQPSKKDVVPEDWTLIVGDSYAEGLGDWLHGSIDRGNPPFQASHVLHELTGEDVISFGMRGAGSFFAYVVQPIRAFSGINVSKVFEITQPREILVYFYEGNDLADNWFMLDHDFARDNDRDSLHTPGVYRAYLETKAEEARHAGERRWYLTRNAHLLDTATKLVKLTAKQVRSGTFLQRTSLVETAPERTMVTDNYVAIGDAEHPFPHAAASPNYFLSETERTDALFVFRESLRYLGETFPDATLRVIYVPEPVSVYDWPRGDLVIRDLRRGAAEDTLGPETRVDAGAVLALSDRTCEQIRAEAEAQGIAFVDTRALIRAEARQAGPLHGPSDWGHFNRRGYETLARAIAQGRESQGACARLGS